MRKRPFAFTLCDSLESKDVIPCRHRRLQIRPVATTDITNVLNFDSASSICVTFRLKRKQLNEKSEKFFLCVMCKSRNNMTSYFGFLTSVMLTSWSEIISDACAQTQSPNLDSKFLLFISLTSFINFLGVCLRGAD